MTLADALTKLCDEVAKLPTIPNPLTEALTSSRRELALHRQQQKKRSQTLKGRAGRKRIPAARRLAIGTAEGTLDEIVSKFRVSKTTAKNCRKEFRQ